MHPDSDNGDRYSSTKDSQNKVSRNPVYRQSDIPTEHIVRAVGDVDDVHHPENQGKPTRQKEEYSRKGDSTEGLHYKKFHRYHLLQLGGFVYGQ